MRVLVALGGLIFVARLNSVPPKAGVGFELDVVAAVFIGGASAYGGVGKVLGAVVGAFIMGVMSYNRCRGSAKSPNTGASSRLEALTKSAGNARVYQRHTI